MLFSHGCNLTSRGRYTVELAGFSAPAASCTRFECVCAGWVVGKFRFAVLVYKVFNDKIIYAFGVAVAQDVKQVIC